MRAVQRHPRAVGTVIAVTLAAAAAITPSNSSRAQNASADAGKTGLRIVDTYPLRVAGRGFRSAERVRVRVTARELRRARRVTANRSGRFKVRFGAVPFERCGSALILSARGSQGSRATLKVPQFRCPPVHDPGPDTSTRLP